MPSVNKDIDLEWEDIESVIEELDEEEQADAICLMADSYLGEEPYHPGLLRAAAEIGSDLFRLRFVVELVAEWADPALRRAIIDRLMMDVQS